jgi:hypothetical protein
MCLRERLQHGQQPTFLASFDVGQGVMMIESLLKPGVANIGHVALNSIRMIALNSIYALYGQ